MKYQYENLGDDQFEDLVIELCTEMFGIGVRGFAKGVDGGRDARFSGKATSYPSATAPWEGKVVIQAKHTSGYNKSFSDSDFFSDAASKTATLNGEIPKIEKLKNEGELDFYMLFANRKLTAGTDEAIRKKIQKETGLDKEHIAICDVEFIERCIKRFPGVVERVDLAPINSPLIVSPDELSHVVDALAIGIAEIPGTVSDPIVTRIPYEVKNQRNNMSAKYAANFRRNYLKFYRQIDDFLTHPRNRSCLDKYLIAVAEFESEVIARRGQYESYDEVIQWLSRLLSDRDSILRKHKRLTNAVLFYMYYKCDLGSADDDNSGQALES